MSWWFLAAGGGLLLLGWVGYPAVCALWASRRETLAAPSGQRSSISVVIATRDSANRTVERVANIRAACIPSEQLEVIVALDASIASDASAFVQLLGESARVVSTAAGPGKALALNAGVAAASGDVLVFADTAQSFSPQTIPELVGYLDANPTAGAASGAYRATGEGKGSTVLGGLWSYEVMLRRFEARIHSLVAVTGANYAMRRSLWEPLPSGAICDDLFVPLSVVRQGWRVGLVESAVATDPRKFTRPQEFSRKVRTLTGMVQFIRARPWILTPVNNPVWLQFFCHKVLRLLTPHLALICVAALFALGAGPVVLELVLAAIMVLGLIRVLKPALGRRLVDQAVWVVWLQAAPLIATWRGLRANWDVWRV